MQINRLFEIIYLLLDKKTITAGELAKRFEVSSRTIYRDIDTLSQAGIPIYTTKGVGGGIHLTDNFVLNKSVLTEMEQKNILSSLQGMNALKVNEMQPILNKLSALFGEEQNEWIEVDFSYWNPENPIGKHFSLLKEAIFTSNVLQFNYSGANGSAEVRIVEPTKLIFKGAAWYLQAWCRFRQDFRFFKLSRMDNLTMLEDHFIRRTLPKTDTFQKEEDFKMVQVKAMISSKMEYRVRDDFSKKQFKRQKDGSFLVTFEMPEHEWLYEYLLAYGAEIKVLEPEHVKKELIYRFKTALNQYEI
ncbi:YafY family protein [Sinanaerobacter sp. ZZT-01]|uniref:helix-turn-helix transcriptional regulator n=1 Tax=Sinanaerobacter sp. ZZT-01 TaxID=3111540 RepID=UPI002D777FC8|nr:YafY family protein [Sinanaerobacter sp. ZZT-01]WRR92310.1 YafY family protein [Sinanaerobacter sp. ZZT-01]